MPNKKKKYSARFPPARIKKIMQKDDEVGKVAAAVPVIISRSLELFVESLIKKTNNLVVSRNARTLTPQHIKQTVLVENEFKFLHELVSTIPDVQCTEDEQPSSHLPHQPPLQEVSSSRPATDHATTATNANNTSSTSVAKPGGKQRGRPRKIKPEETKQSRPKKPRLASTVEECDSEETCSGSEEDNKESNDQSKQAEKASSSTKLAHYLPPCPSMPATLPNTILFNAPLLTGQKNHTLGEAFPTISMELPKMSDAYMTLNGNTTGSSLASQQLSTAQHTPSNEEALDLSTSGGKNGDLKVKKDVAGSESVVGHQNLLLNKTVPRTFYMTSILNANVHTVSGPGLLDASMNQPQQHSEAYKLNIPKISVQKPGQPLIRQDIMSPSALAPGSRPSLSQPLQNFDHPARPAGSPPAVTYQFQNLAQKGHQIIFSQMRPDMAQNIPADAQMFNAGSPVRLLQYPRFVSLVPGAQFGGIKSPNPPSEESKLNPQPEKCPTKDSANESQS